MKVVSLVSSGIDSPVATYLLLRYTGDGICVHADNNPYTDTRETDKFIQILRQLKQYIPGSLKAYIISHGTILAAIQQNCKPKLTCVLCKRMLVRYAETIATLETADALVMGDSLGQVASQTLHNIRIIEEASRIPILRPLIGMDKEDITRIAKTIGTYDLSIRPSDGCTAVPKKPATHAHLDEVIAEEKKIDIQRLVDQAVKHAKMLFP